MTIDQQAQKDLFVEVNAEEATDMLLKNFEVLELHEDGSESVVESKHFICSDRRYGVNRSDAKYIEHYEGATV